MENLHWWHIVQYFSTIFVLYLAGLLIGLLHRKYFVPWAGDLVVAYFRFALLAVIVIFFLGGLLPLLAALGNISIGLFVFLLLTQVAYSVAFPWGASCGDAQRLVSPTILFQREYYFSASQGG